VSPIVSGCSNESSGCGELEFWIFSILIGLILDSGSGGSVLVAFLGFEVSLFLTVLLTISCSWFNLVIARPEQQEVRNPQKLFFFAGSPLVMGFGSRTLVSWGALGGSLGYGSVL
jgi:hypothetical protein